MSMCSVSLSEIHSVSQLNNGKPKLIEIFCGFSSANTCVYYPNEEFYSLALLGCVTTSWLFGIGKAAVLKKFRTNKALQETAKVFDSVSSSAEDIQLAGEKTLVIVYNVKKG